MSDPLLNPLQNAVEHIDGNSDADSGSLLLNNETFDYC
jgi:hypothetical protein